MVTYKKLLFLLITFAVASCGSGSYDPADSLTPHEKDLLMSRIVRYAVQAPENVNGDERFNKTYDQYYQERASACRLEQYSRKGDLQYFLISQPAPSLSEKRHATGGLIAIEDGQITRYEEVFRTWKMIPDTLKRRSYLLFDKMVKGESLDRFRTKFTAPEEYIEFPDDHTWFDPHERAWKVR